MMIGELEPVMRKIGNTEAIGWALLIVGCGGALYGLFNVLPVAGAALVAGAQVADEMRRR